MSSYFPREGLLREGSIFSVLYHIFKHSISGCLTVGTDEFEKQLLIEDGKIVFAESNLKADAFGDYLLRHHVIDREAFQKTGRFMEEKKIRFGRALVEQGYLDYDQIWTWVPKHLQAIVFSFFKIKTGEYRILPNYERDIENIVLDLDILGVVLEGIRNFKSLEFLEQKFKDIEHLYVCNTKRLSQMELKPYEMHVFDLVKRNRTLPDILKSSELLEFDTLRLLFLFLVVEVISTRPDQRKKEPNCMPEESVAGFSTFTSFDEALKYYNLKYELIYKTLSKEIGPIALSLLFKAVEDVIDTLPAYFQKIQFTADGRIAEEPLIRSLWYYDFNRNISDFLRGLEEILYTEVYTVKKHLGTEYEQQVLKWIRGIGN